MKHIAIRTYRWSATIKEFFNRLHSHGQEKVTIMIVPTSQNKIRNFHVPFYFLYLCLGMLVGLIAFNLFSLVSSASHSETYKQTLAAQKQFEKDRKAFTSRVTAFANEWEGMKPQISQMLYLSQKDIHGKRYDIWAMGGTAIMHNASTSNDILFPDSPRSDLDLKLQKLNHDIDVTKSIVGKVNEYMATTKEVFDKLPVLWPLPDGGYVSSEFGWREYPLKKQRAEFHTGLDIANYAGSPIVATADGVVQTAGYVGELGNFILINHAFGFSTRYGHCLRLKVASGQRVRRGQVIAYVGTSGRSTGYHLHYEIRIGATPVDPWPYILRMK
jgi:murein DD-endopeptidase MepM/ murein hydrolase activator NlpD